MLFMSTAFLPTPALPSFRHSCSSSRFSCPSSPTRLRRTSIHASASQNSRKKSPPPPSSSSSVSNSTRADLLEVYFDLSSSPATQTLGSAWSLGSRNFTKELRELVLALSRTLRLEPPGAYAPPDCLNLKLSNTAVRRREDEREATAAAAAAAGAEASADTLTVDGLWFGSRWVYHIVCGFVDIFFNKRPIERLWFLEIVARMPYFAYTSCLHLYSTFGWWRSPELMNLHYAEQVNETFHVAVMESLGGDRRWGDRFVTYHAALFYFWILVALFFVSPPEAYRFSQALESHAVDTYAEFIDANEGSLRELPPPAVAFEYFDNFLFYFDEFQMTEEKRRPVIESLYDVFENIMKDELEHSSTMAACVDFTFADKSIRYNGEDIVASARRSGETQMSKEERKKYWKKWAEAHQDV